MRERTAGEPVSVVTSWATTPVSQSDQTIDAHRGRILNSLSASDGYREPVL